MKLANIFILLVCLCSFLAPKFARADEEQKLVNIHTNPLTLIIGAFSLGADFAINDKVTLGGSTTFLNYKDDDGSSDIRAKASSFGVRVQYFFNQALNDSWYITGFGESGKGEVDDYSDGEFADLKMTSMGLTAGYFWRWSTLTLQLGLGLQNTNVELTNSNLSADDREKINDLDGFGLAGDLRLGLAF